MTLGTIPALLLLLSNPPDTGAACRPLTCLT
jgi:hypothetical protein